MSTPVVKRALISVSNKTGVVAFAKHLHQLNIHILATGNTARLLEQAGIPITAVSTYTGFPEIMGGRVKTLHPKIHGALLHRGEPDAATMQDEGIDAIDLVVVNLYPFEDTVKAHPNDHDRAIEHIDIGGPTLLRAGAKNHRFVAVVNDPGDYPAIAEALQTKRTLSDATRLHLARKAFQHVAEYDHHIATYFQRHTASETTQHDTTLAPTLTVDAPMHQALRYGENPQQAAAFYAPLPHTGLSCARSLQGRTLSYNNLLDTDAAWQLVRAFTTTACVIVKHAGPCGVALGDAPLQAYQKALSGDPVSAFGGIIAFNVPVDENTAKHIVEKQYAEVIIAPDFSESALAALQKKPKIRVLALDPQTPHDPALRVISIDGGYLVQQPDTAVIARERCDVVTHQQPTETQWEDALFAYRVVKSVKSNAIVLAKNQQSIGIGPGQPSRVVSARIAIAQAAHFGFNTQGCVLSSDAFFPFADSIALAHEAAVGCIIQPGGSIRDKEVIDAANQHGIAMIFTHQRHFRH